MRTIAITNQKGGCGKTTTAVNLAAALAASGQRVLAVDLDPQGHATLALGVEPDALDVSLYDAIMNEYVPIRSIITPTYIEGLDVAPSNVLLSGAEAELAIRHGKEHMLSQRLIPIQYDYDICVIDCSPSLSILTVNALTACRDVIIPVQTHYYALEGLKQLLKTISIVSTRFNQRLQILGVLLTLVDSGTLLSRDIQQQLRGHFGELVFDTVIHRTVRLAEAPSAGESILTYDPHSRGALEYMALAEEVCKDETQSGIAETSFVNI